MTALSPTSESGERARMAFTPRTIKDRRQQDICADYRSKSNDIWTGKPAIPACKIKGSKVWEMSIITLMEPALIEVCAASRNEGTLGKWRHLSGEHR